MGPYDEGASRRRSGQKQRRRRLRFIPSLQGRRRHAQGPGGNGLLNYIP